MKACNWTEDSTLVSCILTWFLLMIYCSKAQLQVISEPDDVTICEGEGAVFTCVLNGNIRSDDVQWYRFIKDTSTTVMVDPNGENIKIMNHTNGSTTNSSLTVTNAIKSYTGHFWVRTPSLNVCNASLTVLAGPSALTVNVIKNIINLSVVVQWDAVDDSLHTTYTVTWTDNRDLHGGDTVDEQTSYTITGLTLDTVYTITVTAANMCGGGPEFKTSIFISTNATSTTRSTITAATTTIVSTNSTTAITYSSTTTTAMINLNTTTNSMTTVFSEDTGITITKTTTNLGASTATTTVLKGSGMTDDSGLSTGAAVAITFVVTFIASVTVTAIITFIVTYYVCVKRTLDKACTKRHLPQEKEQLGLPTSPITKHDLKLQPNPMNPPYDHDASHVYEVVADTNASYSTVAYEIIK